MRHLFFLSLFIGLLAAVTGPLATRLHSRPLAEKLGFVPHPRIVRLAAADQKLSAAAYVVFRTMMYFGGLTDRSRRDVPLATDYAGILQNMQAATELDPYNMDSYYFSQAILTWDMGGAAVANKLLIKGMQYRDWDFYLPLFVGFNAAYFLKDYETAAHYYRRAGELSDAELYKKLAARYLYESRDTEHAILYMRTMIQSARNKDVKTTFEVRLKALEAIQRIETALDAFQKTHVGKVPTLAELRASGLLETVPEDPYGGVFYVDERGRVRTTSKLAFGGTR